MGFVALELHMRQKLEVIMKTVSDLCFHCYTKLYEKMTEVLFWFL